ncbi:MAG: M20/M25/M40 family metallo-hydrolase [Candidatus Peregrinibacteria bacterium]|nr:M20/M25/M40 family metallo-hydrolase [Candidatus Peregrinibacteria bacterium]
MNPLNDKDSTREHLVNLTKELIRFPSHCDEPLKVFDLINFIKEYFAKDRLNIAEHVLDGSPHLVITTEDTKHPHIMLSGHIDVVCSLSKFTAEIKGDKLYGSGAMDMKGGVACMMAIMKYFANQKERPSIGIMLTSDEETGGAGTYKLLEEEGYCTDFCIVNEGRSRYEIVTREKGFLAIKIKMKGEAIHSAYPWRGKNVLEELMRICLNIQSHFPKPKKGWVPTATITSVKGGKQVNTIPDEAEAIMSFRLTGTKKWNREVVLEMIHSRAKGAEVQEMIWGEVFEVNPENQYVQILHQAAKEVRQKRMSLAENNGASDARFFMGKNIPTAILGPVGTDHHTVNEWVSIESIVTHYEVLKRFIENERDFCAQEAEELELG